MKIVGLGKAGCRVAKTFSKFPQYETVGIDTLKDADITIRRHVHLGGDWRRSCRFLPNLRAGCAIYEIGRGG